MSGTLGDPNERPFAEPEREGCLEVALAAWLLLPGRYTMSKRHVRVRCLSLNRLDFVISASVWSPKIFTRGLYGQ